MRITNTPQIASKFILPFARMENIFNPDELKDVISYFRARGTEPGRVGGIKDDGFVKADFRKSQVMLHEPTPQNNWIFERLNLAIEEANDHFYRFDLIGYDKVQYTEYHAPGDFYDYHTDMSYGMIAVESYLHRKLSFSLILSDPSEYKGGEFEFIASHQQPIIPEQRMGDLLVFPSFVLHKVAPVTEGIRRSLVGWVLGPKFK